MADSTIQSLRDDIDARIVNSGPEVRENAINHFADIEKKRRVDIIIAAIVAQREIETDLRKINRADQVFYDESGLTAQSHFTKGRLNEIKKLKEKIAKLLTAVNGVLKDTGVTVDDFDKLEKAIKTAKQKGGDKPPEEDMHD